MKAKANALPFVNCPACGRRNSAGLEWCRLCGAAMAARSDPTKRYEVVDLSQSHAVGAVAVDRSAFRPSEGLLVVNEGAKAGARIALDADLLLLGRDPSSDIFLDDITVSFRHAQVRRENVRYWISDLGSLNGTYLNRRRIEEDELHEGDEVQIGKFKLMFVRGTASG